jgi:hypothetical protein
VSTNSFCAKSHSFRGENAQENGERKREGGHLLLTKRQKITILQIEKVLSAMVSFLPLQSRLTARSWKAVAVNLFCCHHICAEKTSPRPQRSGELHQGFVKFYGAWLLFEKSRV